MTTFKITRDNVPQGTTYNTDVPYNIGINAFASSTKWYKDGDNKNGESELAKTSFFDTDKDFRISEFMHPLLIQC